MQLKIVYCIQQYAVIHQLDAGMNCTTTLVTKSLFYEYNTRSNFLVLHADPRCIEVQIQLSYTMMAMDGWLYVYDKGARQPKLVFGIQLLVVV